MDELYKCILNGRFNNLNRTLNLIFNLIFLILYNNHCRMGLSCHFCEILPDIG